MDALNIFVLFIAGAMLFLAGYIAGFANAIPNPAELPTTIQEK